MEESLRSCCRVPQPTRPSHSGFKPQTPIQPKFFHLKTPQKTNCCL